MGVTFPSLIIGPHKRCELESEGYMFAGYTRSFRAAGDEQNHLIGNPTTLRRPEWIRRSALLCMQMDTDKNTIENRLIAGRIRTSKLRTPLRRPNLTSKCRAFLINTTTSV